MDMKGEPDKVVRLCGFCQNSITEVLRSILSDSMNGRKWNHCCYN